jgi:hypothetical protein
MVFKIRGFRKGKKCKEYRKKMVIYGCRNGRKGMHGTVSREVQIRLGRARVG